MYHGHWLAQSRELELSAISSQRKEAKDKFKLLGKPLIGAGATGWKYHAWICSKRYLNIPNNPLVRKEKERDLKRRATEEGNRNKKAKLFSEPSKCYTDLWILARHWNIYVFSQRCGACSFIFFTRCNFLSRCYRMNMLTTKMSAWKHWIQF